MFGQTFALWPNGLMEHTGLLPLNLTSHFNRMGGKNRRTSCKKTDDHIKVIFLSKTKKNTSELIQRSASNTQYGLDILVFWPQTNGQTEHVLKCNKSQIT